MTERAGDTLGPSTGGGEPPVDATVIVPAHNAAGTLRRCLSALAAEGVPGPRAELIVVDDGSTDETGAIARQLGARVIRTAGRGPAAARNEGARQAHGGVLIFLDADTAPEPGWLTAMLAPMADPTIAGVKGRYRTAQSGLVARFTQLEFEDKYARLTRAATIDFVDTGTAAFRREPFLAAAGFDESFPASSAEDVDLAFRMAARGARFVFSPQANVLHCHPDRLAAYLTKKVRYGYFRVRVYRRHPDKALGDSYTPRAMAYQIGLAGLAAGLLGLRVVRVPRAGTAAVAALAVFAGTTVPLVRRALATDPSLAAAVPVLVFARAFAQGCGIAVGLLAIVKGGARRGVRT